MVGLGLFWLQLWLVVSVGSFVMVWFGLFAIVLVAIVCSWLVVSVGET